jgi:hypothetical protein
VRLARSFDGGKTWDKPVALSDPALGAAVFPWVAAAGDGHAVVVWYQSDAQGDSNDATAMRAAKWRVAYAESFAASASAPRFDAGFVTPAPIHAGTVSTQGLSASGGPDRSLGDFLSAAIDAGGRVHVAFTTTTGSQPEVTYARSM